MRDLKELLELVLYHWQKNQCNKDDNFNEVPGLCYLIDKLMVVKEINIYQWGLLSDWMKIQLRKEKKVYLFDTFLHYEREEWLKEKIENLGEC